MKWCTYRTPGRSGLRTGVLDAGGDHIYGLEAGVTLLSLLEGDLLSEAGRNALHSPAEVVGMGSVELAPPIPRPPSFRDFMSFETHLQNSARMMSVDVPEAWYRAPAFYFSNAAAMLGPNEPVKRPPATTALDYELEVAAVVGRAGSDLTPDQAKDHIAGYLVLCDWSARDFQREEIPLTMGPSKSKDFATSLSGFLVTPDELVGSEIAEGYDLSMTADVNGRRYSEGNLRDLHWSFPEMIAAASRNTIVSPGDIIGSGTVGTGCILELSGLYGPEAFPYLSPGDRVRLEVAGIGVIEAGIHDASGIGLRGNV
ncbi:fumarylacetoacetate hydrolase family protein [Prescottella agglutinans]|uniref:Fumarylacetoacetate hydrolase family protein n=1 Tax=Prescottella agglutinans TaxID=1644129 RepID=A0A3S3ADQ7_9NOCA|nr:fumarylacetoacetate hydrolase family protein [Prescottella agglutinans]RVW07806.1 fumarylacetoacetate hydrolase family protein [Prescottella agglutinans]